MLSLFQSKAFWIIAKAVRDFIENEGNGHLPLQGSLPDMTAETSRYIALQQMLVEVIYVHSFYILRLHLITQIHDSNKILLVTVITVANILIDCDISIEYMLHNNSVTGVCITMIIVWNLCLCLIFCI